MDTKSKFMPLTEDDQRCAKCYYHFRYGQHGVGCEFILVTGHRRDCEPGIRCKRFLEGDPRPRWHMPEGQVLRPGWFYGEKEKPVKATVQEELPPRHPNVPEDRQLLPMNTDRWDWFRQEHNTSELTRALGVSPTTIYDIKKRGTISRRMARQILELYEVDLIQH